MELNQLEQTLWKAADKLRGGLSSDSYMHVTLGLIFLKYVSDRFEQKREEIGRTKKVSYQEDKDYYLADNVFWIPEKARWTFISRNSKSEKLGSIIDDAFTLIEKENEQLKDVLPKNYSKIEVDARRLSELVDLFTNELNTNKLEGDAFGRIYEYFMGTFARNQGQKGGEFYTPRSIVELMVELIQPFTGKIYDPCCGAGGMFVQSANFVKQHQGEINKISVYGQELNATTWKLAKMNLAIRGIESNLGTSNADTLHDDKHSTKKFDYILANPPFNISDYGRDQLEGDHRWIYGPPPSGNANYAWIQHMVNKLNDKGVAAFILANGSLSTSNKLELEIRKKMLEKDIVECIIALPSNLFYTTAIPASIWIVRKGKALHNSNKVLFFNLNYLGNMVTRKQREFSKEDIKRVVDVFNAWRKNDKYKDIKGFCKSSSLKEILESDYSLVPGRYVGTDEGDQLSKEEIELEIKKLSMELEKLFEEKEELEKKVRRMINDK